MTPPPDHLYGLYDAGYRNALRTAIGVIEGIHGTSDLAALMLVGLIDGPLPVAEVGA